MAEVHAQPAKRFFIDVITRDITFEAAILDLIDNSLDSFMRHKGIDVTSLLEDVGTKDNRSSVTITLATGMVSIADDCGGIEYDDAINEVFRFGKTDGLESSVLSVYGIGLKRAVFKIGREIRIFSQTLAGAFVVHINTEEWLGHDRWTFPIQTVPLQAGRSAGTTVEVRSLHPGIVARLESGTLQSNLESTIGTSYP